MRTKIGVKYGISPICTNLYKSIVRIKKNPTKERGYMAGVKINKSPLIDKYYNMGLTIPIFNNMLTYKNNIFILYDTTEMHYISNVRIFDNFTNIHYCASIKISDIYNRYPFYVLDYNKSDTSIHREIIYDGYDLYMNVNGNIIKASTIAIEQTVNELLNVIHDAIESKYNTIEDMILDHESLMSKIDNIKGDGINNGINYILDKFKGLKIGTIINDEINNKATIGFDSGVLSDNDFTDEYLDIINSAEFGAKKYTHPKIKQCKYISPVQSIFGRTGEVIITAEDFDLSDVDPNANNYMHPRSLECAPIHVKSVNGISLPSIKISKGTVGLENLVDGYASTGIDNIINKVNDQYLIMDNTTKEYIDNRVSIIKSIPDINNECIVNITINSTPNISTNPMRSMTTVTVYGRTLDISRLYTNNPTHSLTVPVGEHIIKIDGYDGDTHIIVNKHININKDSNFTIDLKESDYID